MCIAWALIVSYPAPTWAKMADTVEDGSGDYLHNLGDDCTISHDGHMLPYGVSLLGGKRFVSQVSSDINDDSLYAQWLDRSLHQR